MKLHSGSVQAFLRALDSCEKTEKFIHTKVLRGPTSTAFSQRGFHVGKRRQFVVGVKGVSNKLTEMAHSHPIPRLWPL